jgi:hypothetical protein
MRTRALVAAALTLPAVLGIASAAQAQDDYSPEVLSTQIVFCDLNDLNVTVDGVQSNSLVRIRIDWDSDNVFEVDVNNVEADGTGFATRQFPIPDVTAVFTVVIDGFVQSDPDDPDVFPFERTIPGDRTACPDLPNTGGDAFPIGKVALAVTLAGALLAAVAIRRRPRDEEEVLVG